MKASEIEPKKLVIFDIDDTLVYTQTKVHVIKRGQIVKSLNSHDFTHYQLDTDEEFDFGDFRNAKEFFDNSKPNIPMMDQLKRDINTGNKVVMVTARADFDDKELFLDTFRKFGVNMSKVHVYRAGNSKQGSTEQRKKQIIKMLLDKDVYSKAIMYDDAKPNLHTFMELKKDYSKIKFYAWHVSLDGQASEYMKENFAENQSYDCPRTKAASCQCESVNKITEAQQTLTAICVLEHSDKVQGTILFKQQPGASTLIVGKITGLAPGAHGFHIHEFGDLSNGCESAGKHYDPDGVDHGDTDQGHVGDLGNVTADKNGVADVSIVAKRIDLAGDRSVVGRAVVIHQDQDDLGQGGDAESLKTGNAGDRLACGVITLKETVNENFADGKKPGRKGLAKRSGVNTKATVSSLRKTAKNSSGEKQRMAHWMANMKAGRAKNK